MTNPRLKSKIEFQRVDIGGTCINFPFSPYDIQVDYMRKVLECLDGGQNGLLESPTGTGKTLSLLCSTLGWLEKAKAAAQVAKLQSYSSSGAGGEQAEVNPALMVRHKVIYSSRTHSQLSQAVAELGRTSYSCTATSLWSNGYYITFPLQIHEGGHPRLQGPALR